MSDEPITKNQKDSADHIGVSVSTIQRMVREGKLVRCANIPGCRYSVADLDALVSPPETAPAAEPEDTATEAEEPAPAAEPETQEPEPTKVSDLPEK